MTEKTGETIVENFDSIDSENELAAAHTFVAEIVATQRSSTDRDMILKYADAFYAEFADKMIQARLSTVLAVLACFRQRRQEGEPVLRIWISDSPYLPLSGKQL